MPEMCVPQFRIVRLSAVVALAAIVFTPSAASAQTSLGSAQPFAALGGTAVTCTASTITGDIGVWPGNAVTKTGCAGTGTVHAGDVVAKAAYTDFINAYTKIATNPPACRATLTGTLAGQVLLPGVYCVDAVAKAGTLMLDAQGNPNATWTFLVNGALTGTSFKVMMLNGGQPCNVTWWVKDASTFTTSNVLGTILSGAGITFTGGTLTGDALATTAVTLTNTVASACTTGAVIPTGGNGGHGDHDGDDDHDGHGDHDGDHDGHHGDKDHDKDHKDKKDKGHDDDRDEHGGKDRD